MTSILSDPSATTPALKHSQVPELFKAAQKLEAAFLAEMLKSAQLYSGSEAMGGGIGEEQFQSLLTHAQAERMTEAGGIGLAEVLFNALNAKYADEK